MQAASNYCVAAFFLFFVVCFDVCVNAKRRVVEIEGGPSRGVIAI